MDAIKTTYISMFGGSDETKKPWTTKMSLYSWKVRRTEVIQCYVQGNDYYLHPVETMLFFVEASRNADLSLHLQR